MHLCEFNDYFHQKEWLNPIKNYIKMQKTNYKIVDTWKIVDYLNASFISTISVDDIIQNSGADKFRVYPALFELEQAGYIEVVEREELGAPLVVRRRRDASQV